MLLSLTNMFFHFPKENTIEIHRNPLKSFESLTFALTSGEVRPVFAQGGGGGTRRGSLLRRQELSTVSQLRPRIRPLERNIE